MKPQQKRTLWFAILAALFLLMGHLTAVDSLMDNEDAHKAEHFTEKLYQLQHEQEKWVSKVADVIESESTEVDSIFKYIIQSTEKLYRDCRIGVSVYKGDKLVCWSDNHGPIMERISDRRKYKDGEVFNMGNGWYYSRVMEKEGYTVVSLLLLKKDYELKNRFLHSQFNPNLPLPESWSIVLEVKPEQEAYEVSQVDGGTLFYLTPPVNVTYQSGANLPGIVAFGVGLLFLVLLFGSLVNWIGDRTRPIVGFCTLVVILVAFRVLMQSLKYPAVFYGNSFFDPVYFASSDLLPSLGDFFINAVLLSYACWFFRRNVSIEISQKGKRGTLYSITILLISLLLLLPISELLKSLVLNSGISFDLNDLFALDVFSIVGFLLSAALLLAYFLFVEKLLIWMANLTESKKDKAIAFGIAALAFVVIGFSVGAEWLLILICVLVLSVMLLEKYATSGNRGVFGSMALILVFSFFSCYHFVSSLDQKERSARQFKASKIAEEQDPVAEYLFTQVSKTITNDRVLKSYLTFLPAKADDFKNRVIQDFLGDYSQKYDININVYDNQDSLLISSDEENSAKYKYNNYLRDGLATASPNLIYNPDYGDKVTYIARIPFDVSRNQSLHNVLMFIEFREKTISPERGFFELLIDEKITPTYSLKKYSFARYVDGEMAIHHGYYPYPAELDLIWDEDTPLFYEAGEHDHFWYSPVEDVVILISKPVANVLQKLTFFSFLFLFNSGFIVLLLGMSYYGYSREYLQNNFKNRINLAIISLLTMFLLMIGGGTIYYVLKQYDQKNREVLAEKVQSVATELRQKVTNKSQLDQSTADYLTYLLTKFSSVFFTDINLFDLEGNLLASSRSKIFDENLVSRKMDEGAYYSVAVEGRANYIHDEHIGKLKYLSTYVPFYNDNDKLLAYLNLPYFAKQDGLRQELQSLLSALINAYVLLIMLAIVLALFITERISEPLRVISDNLREIRLGQTNKQIQWESKDEIGKLIAEYNRVISELQHNAELLAKSERESAWREMAKQVAHEIKNPLTPMKLSVQQLQRAYTEQKPGWDKNISRVMEVLLEQIDTLSNIASEFSSFAKMPKPENKPVQIARVMENVVELYKESEGVSLTFVEKVDKETLVFADENQMQRAFNNLVQNAIQAIPDGKEGEVKISLEEENEHVLIIIRDNGTGISEDLREKIFVPNFTTKTGGMGLGLAMVRNIIESVDGEIWFETVEDEGTTFYIRLKRLES